MIKIECDKTDGIDFAMQAVYENVGSTLLKLTTGIVCPIKLYCVQQQN